MKGVSLASRLGWVFYGLIAIATILIFLGRAGSGIRPSINSYDPAGLHVLADLLRKKGYEVTSTGSVKVLPPNDALCIFVTDQAYWVGITDAEADDRPHNELVSRILKRGGSILMTYVSAEAISSDLTQKDSIYRSDDEGSEATITDQSDDFGHVTFFENELGEFLWIEDQTRDPMAWILPIGSGTVTYAKNGNTFTNRWITEADNAAYAFDVIESSLDGKTKIVFLDSAFGEIKSESLAELIGPWFNGAWTQITFIFAILVITLGIRFGKPEEKSARQRGMRELIDAYADVLSRSRSTRVALEQLISSSDLQVRRRFKIALDAHEDVRNQAIPDRLVMAFRSANNALSQDVPEHAIFTAAKELSAATDSALENAAVFMATTRRRKV